MTPSFYSSETEPNSLNPYVFFSSFLFLLFFLSFPFMSIPLARLSFVFAHDFIRVHAFHHDLPLPWCPGLVGIYFCFSHPMCIVLSESEWPSRVAYSLFVNLKIIQYFYKNSSKRKNKPNECVPVRVRVSSSLYFRCATLFLWSCHLHAHIHTRALHNKVVKKVM